ncbi:Ubiquitin carboxyl-terminal hydrolase, partial [Durusdinium trenchii]
MADVDMEKIRRVHWVPLESNPDMLNDFASKVGLPPGFEFVDVFSAPEAAEAVGGADLASAAAEVRGLMWSRGLLIKAPLLRDAAAPSRRHLGPDRARIAAGRPQRVKWLDQ